MTRNESYNTDASVYALNESAPAARFVSSWQLNSKREYPQKEVDGCGCGCCAAPKA